MAVRPPNQPEQSPAATTEESRTFSEIQTSSYDNQPELFERVEETLKPLLKNPSDVRQIVTKVVRITEESYSGPTPHPEHLERIELIAPGSAKDIIGMAVREQRFRHRLATLTVLYPYVGLLFGLLTSVLCFTFAYLLGMAGHVEVACALVGVSALGVIGWFIKARLDEKQDATSRPKSERQNSRRR